MDFKSRVAADVDKVFLNQEVFAETVTINGEQMKVVPEDQVVSPPDTKSRMGNVKKQVAVYDVAFHVATSSFEHIPQADMLMEYEGEEYRIKSVSEDLGMLTIGLSRVDS